MRALACLFIALAIVWIHPVSAACITNNTAAPLYVDQYSLASAEDIFKIEPGQRLCRDHSGMFHRYDVALMPYDSAADVCTTYLARNSDELVIEGSCEHKTGGKCAARIHCGRLTATAKATEHAAVP
ncbi:MAG: hypothetical protein WCO00_09240 [Rhodospirillaceae bacterium]